MKPTNRPNLWAAQMTVQCATTESYTIPILESSYGNIPSCSWPNHSSDVVKWSSRGSYGEDWWCGVMMCLCVVCRQLSVLAVVYRTLNVCDRLSAAVWKGSRDPSVGGRRRDLQLDGDRRGAVTQCRRTTWQSRLLSAAVAASTAQDVCAIVASVCPASLVPDADPVSTLRHRRPPLCLYNICLRFQLKAARHIVIFAPFTWLHLRRKYYLLLYSVHVVDCFFLFCETIKSTVILKPGLGTVIRGDWKYNIQQIVHEFLLLFSSNCGSILHRFYDIWFRIPVILRPWNPSQGSLKVIETGSIRYLAYGFILASLNAQFDTIIRLWKIPSPWNSG